MKNKLIAITILITFFACVDQYDIDSHSDAPYDSYANLGFEDGLEHWHGQANTFSSISIDSNAYEGVNSLKMSTKVDTSLLTESTEPSVAEISKSLDVSQGDTISINYQLRGNNIGEANNIDLLNTSIFHDKDGFVIHAAVDTINQPIMDWSTVNIRYSVPQNAVKLIFGVRMQGLNENAYVLVDDFSISTETLLNQVPSGFSLIAPSDGSILPEEDEIELTWSYA